MMIADPQCEYTEKLGLVVDLTDKGLGKRCKRFSALIKDGKAVALNVEEQPNDFVSTGADTMLEQVRKAKQSS